jgi:hypothetical protein
MPRWDGWDEVMSTQAAVIFVFFVVAPRRVVPAAGRGARGAVRGTLDRGRSL